jgi:hypothetical protein
MYSFNLKRGKQMVQSHKPIFLKKGIMLSGWRGTPPSGRPARLPIKIEGMGEKCQTKKRNPV